MAGKRLAFRAARSETVKTMPFPRSAKKKVYDENLLYDYAVGALARRMRTVAELQRLLRTRVASQPDGERLIAAVTTRLEQQRYLDDSNYATAYSVARRDNDKFARTRVAQDLRTRGVQAEVIAKTLEESYGEIDEASLARQFVERKRLAAPREPKDAARIFRRMARAGFSTRTILTLLRHWHVEDETLSALEQEREQAEQQDQGEDS